jgi:hypothetical protein
VAEDETTVIELVKALSESVTFSEGLLDLAEGLLLRPETGGRPSPAQRMHLRTGMVRWRAGVEGLRQRLAGFGLQQPTRPQ